MDIFSKIAERKIAEAMKAGEFEGLRGAGEPLKAEEPAGTPEELRAGLKILKNAGFLPPELELRQKIATLRELIDNLDDVPERIRKVREFNLLMTRFSVLTGRSPALDDAEYETRVYSKLLERAE